MYLDEILFYRENGYSVELREKMLRDRAGLISSYTKESIDHVVNKMEDHHIVDVPWLKNPPQTAEEANRFYSEIDGYIYELTRNECEEPKIQQISFILEALDKYVSKGSKVLVYGSGVGSEVIPILETKNYSVTAADVTSKTMEFMKWRLTQLSSVGSVNYINTDSLDFGSELETEKYDCIVSSDTIEHVWRPKVLTRNLVRASNKGGVLLLKFQFNKHSGYGKIPPEKLNTHPHHIEREDGVLLRGAHFKHFLLKDLNLELLGNYSDWIKKLRRVV